METMNFASYLNKKQSAPRDKLAAIMELAATYGAKEIEFNMRKDLLHFDGKLFALYTDLKITSQDIIALLHTLYEWGVKYAISWEEITNSDAMKIHTLTIAW